MTFRIERVRAPFLAAAVAMWAGSACIADNRLGFDSEKPDAGESAKPDAGETVTPDVGDSGPLVQYTAISYDPANDQLVVGLVGGLKFFDATDGHKLRELAFGTVLTFVAGRAGNVITAIDSETVWILDEDGNLRRTISQPVGMFAADLAPDGSLIATGDWNGRVHLFRSATGAELAWPAWPEAGSSAIYSVRFSPDGAYLAAASVGDIRVWRISDGAVVTEIAGFGRRMAFSAAGELAIDREGPLDVVTFPGGTTVASYPVDSSQPLIVYSADGTLLAYGPQSSILQVKVVDRVHGETVTLFDDPQTRPPQLGGKPRYMVGLTFAGPDHIAVAWDDGRVAMFRASDGTLVWSRVNAD